MDSNLCLFRWKPERQLEVLQRAGLFEQADWSTAWTRTRAILTDVPRASVLFLFAQRTQQLVVVEHFWRIQESEHKCQRMKENLESYYTINMVMIWI